MRVYFDTGVFIDFLSVRGNSILRTSDRRGRTPVELAADAERLFEKVSRAHLGATSSLTYYEVEEARYAELKGSAKGVSHGDIFLIPAARVITFQVETVVDLFKFSLRPLTDATIRLQLQQPDLPQGEALFDSAVGALEKSVLFTAGKLK